MADPVTDNLRMLIRVVDRLAPLRHRLVFLGGAVTELFITLPGVRRPRQTTDVDVVVNVANLGACSETLREQLVELGPREDTREGAPVCRWILDDLIVDIMPTRGRILGFSSARLFARLGAGTDTPDVGRTAIGSTDLRGGPGSDTLVTDLLLNLVPPTYTGFESAADGDPRSRHPNAAGVRPS